MDRAFDYAKLGMCTEASYPYEAKEGTCQAMSCSRGIPAGAVQGFRDVDPNSKISLMSAIVRGPVSIAIEADKLVFQLYKTGVLDGLCGAKLDHGVLLVGYGS